MGAGGQVAVVLLPLGPSVRYPPLPGLSRILHGHQAQADDAIFLSEHKANIWGLLYLPCIGELVGKLTGPCPLKRSWISDPSN